MKFIEIIKYDIKNGILRNKYLFISVIVISVLFVTDHSVNMLRYDIDCSYGDVLMYIYGGMKKYVASRGNRFQFPAIWTVLFITQLSGTLNYPYKDLNSYGIQILFRTDNRLLWWISKFIWNIIYGIIYHSFIWTVMFIYAVISGYAINFSIDIKILCNIFEIFPEDISGNITDIPVYIFFVPVLTSVVFSLLEMTVSLFIKTVYSFLLMSCLVISSAYLMTDYIIGNYGMIIRSNHILTDGINMERGIIILSVLVITAFIVGLIKFSKYDIINS
ncbi:MAG: hypothetical protein K2K16_01920 [Ruminococcus sp.]|nr:hypothetical protein [Ruminococcus sp.]